MSQSGKLLVENQLQYNLRKIYFCPLMPLYGLPIVYRTDILSLSFSVQKRWVSAIHQIKSKATYAKVRSDPQSVVPSGMGWLCVLTPSPHTHTQTHSQTCTASWLSLGSPQGSHTHTHTGTSTHTHTRHQEETLKNTLLQKSKSVQQTHRHTATRHSLTVITSSDQRIKHTRISTATELRMFDVNHIKW